jgi:hypothetical protein
MKSAVALAVVMSGVACALAVLALARGGRDESVTRPEVVADPARLQEIEKEMQGLRNALEHPAGLDSARLDRPIIDPAAAPPSVPQEVLDRLAAIEKSIESMRRSANERTLRPGLSNTDTAEARRIATDPSADAVKRVAALQALRGSRMADGTDARTHDVVLSMIDLANQSADEATREGVYKNLHGVHDDELRESMVRALTTDSSALVRSKVPEDIDTFVSDPAVQSALRQAADSDSDDGVRAAAQRTLLRRH